MKRVKIIALVVGIVLLAVALNFTNVLNGSETAIAQSTNATKLCSVVDPGNWRDTFTVPATWQAYNCQNFQNSTAARLYQLGCTFPYGFSFGSTNGGVPNPNCGW